MKDGEADKSANLSARRERSHSGKAGVQLGDVLKAVARFPVTSYGLSWV